MDLNKILLISEILGDDYDPNDWNLKPAARAVMHFLGMLFITASIVLLNYSKILGGFFLIGSTIIYIIAVSVNDHDDLSMIFIIPLSAIIGWGILILINQN